MHRIFSGDGGPAVPKICKSAPDHRRSQPLVQQPLVLIILCILSIHVQYSGNTDSRDRVFVPDGPGRFVVSPSYDPPRGRGRGPHLPETTETRVIHEGPPRKTERGPPLFVFICVHLWFVFKRDRQFLPRMICPAAQGWHLPEAPLCHPEGSVPSSGTGGLADQGIASPSRVRPPRSNPQTPAGRNHSKPWAMICYRLPTSTTSQGDNP